MRPTWRVRKWQPPQASQSQASLSIYSILIDDRSPPRGVQHPSKISFSCSGERQQQQQQQNALIAAQGASCRRWSTFSQALQHPAPPNQVHAQREAFGGGAQERPLLPGGSLHAWHIHTELTRHAATLLQVCSPVQHTHMQSEWCKARCETRAPGCSTPMCPNELVHPAAVGGHVHVPLQLPSKKAAAAVASPEPAWEARGRVV